MQIYLEIYMEMRYRRKKDIHREKIYIKIWTRRYEQKTYMYREYKQRENIY